MDTNYSYHQGQFQGGTQDSNVPYWGNWDQDPSYSGSSVHQATWQTIDGQGLPIDRGHGIYNDASYFGQAGHVDYHIPAQAQSGNFISPRPTAPDRRVRTQYRNSPPYVRMERHQAPGLGDYRHEEFPRDAQEGNFPPPVSTAPVKRRQSPYVEIGRLEKENEELKQENLALKKKIETLQAKASEADLHNGRFLQIEAKLKEIDKELVLMKQDLAEVSITQKGDTRRRAGN